MDNVLAAGYLTGKDKTAIVARARELFSTVGISEETQRKFPSQLSGGEAQRAGIVRALINHPGLLFADEPTGALNSKAGLFVMDLLTNFNRQGQSIVMVTHDMRLARRGNRILYLKDGMKDDAPCPLQYAGEERAGGRDRHSDAACRVYAASVADA